MLITTTPELMEYVPVSIDLDFRSIRPALRTAERRFVIPLIGQSLYDNLLEDYDSQALSEAQKKLLSYIGAVTAPLALWYYSQAGGVNVDNSGIYKAKNEGRWNLSDTEQKRMDDFYLNQGLDAIEDLLNFLDGNAADFPDYADSDERRGERRSLVFSAGIVQAVFPLLHPRSTFRAMGEAIGYVEANRVAPLMQDFYAHLLDTSEAGLSEDEKGLRTTARKAVIYLASARALLTRSVKLTHDGLEVMMGMRTQVSDAENARIETAARQYAQSGELALQELQKQLNTLLPAGYTPPVALTLTPRTKNPDDSKVFLI